MRVLVTGGAGFIGSHVVDAYVAAGHTVSVVDDLSTGKRANLNSQATFYEVDIRDRRALAEVFAQERPEAISHQAAKANVRESMVIPITYAEVNVIGSLNLLELAREYGCRRVVYASTGGAGYGEPQYLPADEDHPLNPLDPYGASKHHVEHYLEIYRAHFGIEHCTLRYANVYGPRQDPYGEAGVVAIFAAQMLNGDTPTIYGSGEQERDFVYVSDIARANLLALTAGDGQVLNLGSGVGTSVNAIFAALRRLTGSRCEEVHGEAKAGEVFRIYLKADRAAQVLGWRPEVSLEQGLEETVRWFRENGS